METTLKQSNKSDKPYKGNIISKKTLSEIINDGYHFLDCDEGYWKDGEDKVIEIKYLKNTHIQNCIKMTQRSIDNAFSIDKLHRSTMIDLMKVKIVELEKVLARNNSSNKTS